MVEGNYIVDTSKSLSLVFKKIVVTFHTLENIFKTCFLGEVWKLFILCQCIRYVFLYCLMHAVILNLLLDTKQILR